MLLLISDANILMDVEVGELVAPMFSLGYQFAVPDVLYYEELEEQHGHLLDLGLQIRTLSAKSVERVQELAQNYARPGRNDLFALALAEVEECPLLTGDAALRQAAETEQVEVKGTIWLIGEMVREQPCPQASTESPNTRHFRGRRGIRGWSRSRCCVRLDRARWTRQERT